MWPSKLIIAAGVLASCLPVGASTHDDARSHIAHAFARRQSGAAKSYCKPSQTCWPSDAQWTAFNQTINGRLIKVIPWPEPCFSNPNGDRCQAIKASYNDAQTRSDQPGITENDNWSYCYSNEGDADDCSLQAAAPALGTTLPFRTCKLGRISPYAVDVRGPSDIQATLSFAKKNNIKVVIKNTGHEYLGRASAPDSLMIWTHHLKSLSYTSNWSGTGKPAIVMGAGIQADEAYKFADQKGVTITLGAYNSVGVAGGFAQAGGHGPMTPKYGLAVDNILQYTIVTADGQLRTANAKSNPDLYFALRGGGGGVWGVVTEVVYQVHPPTKAVSATFNITFNGHLVPGDKDAAIADFISTMAIYQPDWTKQGWAGYDYIYDTYISFNHGAPTGDLAAANKTMEPFFDYVRKNKNWTVQSMQIKAFPSFESLRQELIVPGAVNTPVAFSERLASHNAPTLSVQTLTGLLRPVPLQIMSTSPLPAAFGGPSGADTGVNTAFRDSLWEVIVASGWTYGFTEELKQSFADATTRAGDNLRQYGTGTYYSESDVQEKDWPTAFFGNNYNRLVSIKQKYDPDNVFIVWKGIGFQGQESQDSFRCYQKA
ncbi:FAD-binding domain-containing protein [Violaceomyces palustris]|uniref:FAD-binding domain-containing protein n=1 Tax=Violaceomyces palustris TaxID=1673888 RepID=A0ACD0NTZ6_9BASI|nr:FAD-binding domain-containing protein [Violaceomyces palustris]